MTIVTHKIGLGGLKGESTIHWIEISNAIVFVIVYPLDSTVTYPVDSVIHSLNNKAQNDNFSHFFLLFRLWLQMVYGFFSAGDFKPVSKQTPREKEEKQTEEAVEGGTYPCPQDGCTRLFQWISSLEQHLSLKNVQHPSKGSPC